MRDIIYASIKADPLPEARQTISPAQFLFEEFDLPVCSDFRVTESIACLLAEICGTSPDFWMKLQRFYDETRGR